MLSTGMWLTICGSGEYTKLAQNWKEICICLLISGLNVWYNKREQKENIEIGMERKLMTI